MFRVGQKVVCVDDKWREPNIEARPVEGCIYTIRAIYRECFARTGWADAFLLVEIENPSHNWRTLGWHEAGFAADRFRPVVERKTDISIFTAMLTKTPRELVVTSPDSVLTDGGDRG